MRGRLKWWVTWFGALAGLTVILLALRDRLQVVHVALPFLLIVLGGSASGGRILGFALSAAAYVDLHYFFVPYRNSLAMADPLDGIVLAAFLITSVVAAQLTARAERRAMEARQRTAEAEIYRQADALKASLIATLSHDLRTPLTTIKALASKLSQRGEVEGRVIEEEADRLNRLVTDLLDLSRLNARSMPLKIELNMAADLVGATIQRVTGDGGDGRVTICTPQADVLDRAGKFDLVQSVRALGNLVENALKYSPPGIPVEVSFERNGAFLSFHVADRGPGIPAREQERVFEPFYRAPGVAPDVGGAGLGLAIASRLALEQGGTVFYQDRPGGGSVFTLQLPAAELPDEQTAPAAEPATGAVRPLSALR
jgi:two-component system sensor histidine kinase KdpD